MRIDAHWRRVGWRILREAALPLFFAASWGIIVGNHKGSIIDGVSAAGIAFFLVLSLQGQFLRVSKNVRDESNAEDFRASLVSIGDSIKSLHQHMLVTNVLEKQENESTSRPSSYLMSEALNALDSGLPERACRLSAMAFEQGLREFADVVGLDKRMSATEILRSMVDKMGLPGAPEIRKFFFDLLALRSRIVRFAFDAAPIDLDGASHTVEGFSLGLRYIDDWKFAYANYKDWGGPVEKITSS